MASDKMLAGYETIGRFEPIQLYAGEKQPVSTQGTAAAGHIFGKLNDRRETYRFAIVAEVDGELVPFDPFGGGSEAEPGEDGSQIIKGVLPHYLDTSATGHNAAVDTPLFVEAVFNFEAMDLEDHDDAAYRALRSAAQAPGTAITFQKLY